ncbi:MAG: lysophospholipid acyltransferase family protein [Thermoanaerobacteraceae bacterium]
MFYYFAKYIVLAIIKIIFRIKVEGIQNIPEKGPIIICPNHISLLDPPVIGALINRRVYFMAKAELYKNPILGFLLKKGLGAFPVKRGTADFSAIKTALSYLKKGQAVGIFPEGTRSKNGKLKDAEAGVSLLAIKSRALVIPIGISGKYGLFSKINIRIGKPLSFDKYYENRPSQKDLESIGKEIMDEISKLI